MQFEIKMYAEVDAGIDGRSSVAFELIQKVKPSHVRDKHAFF